MTSHNPLKEFKPQRTIMHTLHAQGHWTKVSTQVSVNPQSFAEGAFRKAHRASLLWEGKWQPFVVKVAKDKTTPRSLYFKDIEAQVFAQVWATKYNQRNPPKKVRFAPCYVLEMVDKPGRPVCGAEIFIPGKFRKHNNNVGAVCNDNSTDPDVVMDRLTAQAFSHFTYDASQGQILICDIQGAAGIYTDPQIHTRSGQGFGSGNLGNTGIRAFLLRHKCNEVCRAAGLAPIHAKQLGSGKMDRKTATFNFTTLLSESHGGGSGTMQINASTSGVVESRQSATQQTRLAGYSKPSRGSGALADRAPGYRGASYGGLPARRGAVPTGGEVRTSDLKMDAAKGFRSQPQLQYRGGDGRASGDEVGAAGGEGSFKGARSPERARSDVRSRVKSIRVDTGAARTPMSRPAPESPPNRNGSLIDAADEALMASILSGLPPTPSPH